MTGPVTATTSEKARARRLYETLAQLYPDAHCALHHRNAFELLVATILSAQCTDEAVNKATPNLFARFPTPAAMADADPPAIEPCIKTLGLYRNKAKSLHGTATMLVERHGGEVPADMDALLALPGVARKTANVVLGNAFGINQGVVVDTHVGRLSVRLGLTEHGPKDAVKIERDLIARFPRDRWTMLSHLFIYHGRQVCLARHPRCASCALRRGCPRVGVEEPVSS
jgi:endonuclease III